MWKASLISLICCAFLIGPTVKAQVGIREVKPGERVRVSAATVAGIFVVDGLDRDTLVLHENTPLAATIMVPINSISRLDVRRARSGGAGAWRGAGIGLLAGVGTGMIVGFAMGDDRPGFVSLSAEEKAVGFGALLGGLGAIVGGLIGLASPGEQWERVHFDQHLSFSADRYGSAVVAYTFSF